jgi:ABC-type multidrug transport system fused ATPase/permease subunit
MIPRHLFDFVAIVGMTLLVLIMAEQGKPIDTFITSLGIFAVAAFRLMPSANRILHSMQRLRYNLPVVGKIHHEISMFSTPFKKSNIKKVLTFENKIQIRNVAYIYSGSKKNALSGINITIPKGSSVGFIGESGSGKSTLIDIILGLLEPTKGDVLIDKVNIQDDLRKWQNQNRICASIYIFYRRHYS